MTNQSVTVRGPIVDTSTPDGISTAGNITASGGVTAGSVDIAGHVHITGDVGKGGPHGRVVLEDSANNQTLTLDGGSGELLVGSANNYGMVSVIDNAGAVSTNINGNSGNVWCRDFTAVGGVTAGRVTAGTIQGGSITSTGNITADGEVIANNAKGNPTIVLNGGSALVEIGSANGAGVLDILDASGQLASEISGGFAQFGNGIKSLGTITVQNTDQNGYGIKSSGGNIGVYAHNSTAANGHDVGHDVYLGTRGLAGDFYGDIMVHGSISKPNSMFQIDHPLDPARKYLFHSSVESPDMKNMYDGVAMLDANGEAVVELPAWFEALNTDFRYQLTPIGAPGPNLYIAEEISNNQFRIAGGTPSMRVSWLVTGVRQDAWAKAHRIRVEEDKPAEEQGHYLHPELHGESEEKHVRLVRYPETV